MAVNFLNLPQDSIHETALKRKFAKSLVGDFILDFELHQHRNRSFLARNMTRVLAYHEKRRSQHENLETRNGASLLSRYRGSNVPVTVVNGQSGPNGASANGSSGGGLSATLENGHIHNIDEHDTSKPDVESMSASCLKVKQRSDTFDMPQRRSQRAQLTKQHEDQNAQLSFNIVNIRKKLNFKEYNPIHDFRPNKRVKRESIRCHCHITIWDNRQGLEQIEPIIRKSELCDIATTRLDDGSHYVNVVLEKPFTFRPSELKVAVDSKNGTSLGMGDKYFLEIKIIPTRDDVDWPPIPILGRSEGDQINGLGQLAAEKLQGSLVARYLHLPQAPGSDVPLPMFFLKDGRTHRSKYGMEVNSAWTKGEPKVNIKTEQEEGILKSWEMDDENRPYGRTDSPKVVKPQPKSMPPPSRLPRITFIIDPSTAGAAPKDFRKGNLLGYQCPICPIHSFAQLQELQFHLQTMHSKYNFKLDKEVRHENTGELCTAVFKVTPITISRPRNQDRENQREPRPWSWNAPQQPFDLPAFVKGDQSWVGDQSKKKSNNVAPSSNITIDPLAHLRQARGGFLPAENVPEFRAPARKKYPNIKLNTATEDASIMYTSISHRPVHRDEEARSESDDEMDDEWFVQKSLEALDVEADKYNWAEEDRMLRSKWQKARLMEKLSHPRYLSDGLIRFVRAEREWLAATGNLQRKRAFTRLLDELQQRHVINHEVIRDVWYIIHSTQNIGGSSSSSHHYNRYDPDMTMKDPVSSIQQSARIAAIAAAAGPPSTKEARIEALLSLDDSTCGICKTHINDSFVRGLRCSELDCEAPGVWYHTKCARCKSRDKSGWKCALCMQRMADKEHKEQMQKGKGRALA